MQSQIFKKNACKFIFFLLLVGIFIYSGRFISLEEESVKGFFTGFPLLLSAVVFVIAYVVLTFFIWFGPKDILRIIAAALFGAWGSTLLVWIGEQLNVVVLFTLSRKLGRSFVESRIKGGMQRLDDAIATKSYWGVFFLKFFPVIPFRFLDLGFGLTKISLKKYFTISALASPLRIFTVQFFLTVGMETVTNPQRMAAYLETKPFLMVFVFSYLVGSFIMIAVLRKKARSR